MSSPLHVFDLLGADALAGCDAVRCEVTEGGPGVHFTGQRRLVARRDVRAGECLLVENAMLWTSVKQKAAFNSLAPEAVTSFLRGLEWRADLTSPSARAAVAQLMPEMQSMRAPGGCVLGDASRASGAAVDTLSRLRWSPSAGVTRRDALTAVQLKLIMNKNSFACTCTLPSDGGGSEGEGGGGGARELAALFLCASMMNHSCLPNAAHVLAWNAAARCPMISVIATRSLRAGEEVCARYIGVEAAAKHRRRAALRQTFDFQCECARCAPRADDSMAFTCTACTHGRLLGWMPTCGACGARGYDDTDVMADDRTEALSAFAQLPLRAPPPPPPLAPLAEGEEAEAEAEEGEAGAGGACDAPPPAVVAASPLADRSAALRALCARLHASDASVHFFLRQHTALCVLQGAAAEALEFAARAADALRLQPFAEPPTRQLTWLLLGDAAALAGEPARAAAAWQEALDLERSVCGRLRAARAAAVASEEGDAWTRWRCVCAAPHTPAVPCAAHAARVGRIVSSAEEEGGAREGGARAEEEAADTWRAPFVAHLQRLIAAPPSSLALLRPFLMERGDMKL